MVTEKERLKKLVGIQKKLQSDRLKHLEDLSRLKELKRQQTKTPITQRD